MATELGCLDSMPCHNQNVNPVSSPDPPRPGDVIPDPAGGDCASLAKPTLLTRHAHSGVPAEGDSKAGGDASFYSDSNGDKGNYDAQPGDFLPGDCELPWQIGAQLKLLPMNDQIRELQTIIRDK